MTQKNYRSSQWELITACSLDMLSKLHFSSIETSPSHWVFDRGNTQCTLCGTWKLVFILTFNLDVIRYLILLPQGYVRFLKLSCKEGKNNNKMQCLVIKYFIFCSRPRKNFIKMVSSLIFL